MKKEIINEKNEKGLYSSTTIKEKTPEDGFVYENKKRISISWSEANKPGHYVWHKGYAKKISYATNDPRITRPFAYTICGIFLIIGVISLLLHSCFFGIIFTAIGLFSLSKTKKDIDAIEKDLKNQGHDMDSNEKKEEVRKEFNEIIKNNFEEAKTSTYTKEHFNWFTKESIPIYCIITIVASLFLTIAVHWILGLVTLGICIISGVLFYYIVSKICRH